MKSLNRIRLTKGKSALVDENDFEWLNQWKWYAHNGRGGNNYAARRDERNTMILMHRLITDAPNGMVVDHINCNGLDNSRGNLRVVTNSQNLSRAAPKSGVKGVSFHAPTGKWRARITVNGKEKHLGLFRSKATALKTYNDSAINLLGEFAWLNKI